MIPMDFKRVNSGDDFSAVVQVLNVSHGTVARDFDHLPFRVCFMSKQV